MRGGGRALVHLLAVYVEVAVFFCVRFPGKIDLTPGCVSFLVGNDCLVEIPCGRAIAADCGLGGFLSYGV